MALGVGVFDELTAVCPGRSAAGTDALLTRDRHELRSLCGPASAKQHFMLHRVRDTAFYTDEIIYAAFPVAISSSESFANSICATATRLPRRTTRPVAMK